ncbi:MAG: bifunctional oligoribonuclease/PAP phosphatase NrnA [Elusimicrobiota bacterium]
MSMIKTQDIMCFKEIINKNKSFFLTLHLTPDADACGSMLALYDYLKSLGKKVDVYSKDPLPENLKFLPHSSVVKNSLKRKDYDVAVFFECSVPSRSGIEVSNLNFKTSISIDHHKTAKRYADLNLLDFKSSSTAEIIWYIFKKMNVAINKKMAILLYSGIVTDTGRFHYPQTNPMTHIISAELLRHKFNFNKINDNFFMKTTYQNLRLLARAIESLIISKDGIAIMKISKKDFNDFKAGPQDSENIVNYPMMLKNIGVSVLIKEVNNTYSVAFRSNNGIDVAKVAMAFGGGGHKNASGFKISINRMEYNQLVNAILREIRKNRK